MAITEQNFDIYSNGEEGILVRTGAEPVRSVGYDPLMDVPYPLYDEKTFSDSEEEKIKNILTGDLHFLNKAARYIGDFPVNTTLPLSLVPEKMLEETMRTWAYIILLHDKNEYGLNINYIFEPEKGKRYKRDPKHILLDHIRQIAPLREKEIEKRINNRHTDSRALEIRIMSLEDLETMRTLPENMIPIPMSESKQNKGMPLWDFMGASTSGLMQAACMKMQNEGTSGLTEIIEREILPRMWKVYQRIFPDARINEIITKETILNMINVKNPIGRINLAIYLALTPMERIASDHIQAYHDCIHTFLSSL